MHPQEPVPSASKKAKSTPAPDSQTPALNSSQNQSSDTPHSPAHPSVVSTDAELLADPWLPESRFRPFPKGDVKSNIRNILLTTPEFPRFYADVILHSAPNSHEARILRPQYQKICDRINHMLTSKTCTHIKVTGVRCGSPSLRGEQFCYFHQHAHRGVRRPAQSRLHPIAIIEDEESIQASLMEVINALMRNTIDLKRAELILRALHIAVKNARRAKFGCNASSVVREIPEYAQPPELQDPTAPKDYTAAELEALKEKILSEHKAAVNVGTAAPAVQADQKYRSAAPGPRQQPHQQPVEQRTPQQLEQATQARERM